MRSFLLVIAFSLGLMGSANALSLSEPCFGLLDAELCEVEDTTSLDIRRDQSEPSRETPSREGGGSDDRDDRDDNDGGKGKGNNGKGNGGGDGSPNGKDDTDR